MPGLSNSHGSLERLVASDASRSPVISHRRKIGNVSILCFVNLINYMDRFTVSSVLPKITESFDITKGQEGLLQTAFVLVYMCAAPLFGYLGDRYNRRYLMTFGVFLWCLTTLAGSFMPNYWSFLAMRCLVGVGEASYSTIAPTLIADMFVKDMRSSMLAAFYFAIPVGGGMGYMVGAGAMLAAESLGAGEAWRWGLRVTPVLGVAAVVLLGGVMVLPERGQAEGSGHLAPTSLRSDLVYLARNKSFLLLTAAFTMVAYVSGALSWWGPSFVEMGIQQQTAPNVPASLAAMVFGAVAMVAGISGVPLGSFSATRLRRSIPYADPLVCGVGLVLACPLVLLSLYLVISNAALSFVVVGLGQVFLNLNWSIISDMLLYTVIPTRRGIATSMQILFSHTFGDAGSPYIVGVVADHLEYLYANTSNASVAVTAPSSVVSNASMLLNTTVGTGSMLLNTTANAFTSHLTSEPNNFAAFASLRASLYITIGVLLIGAAFFFACCGTIEADRNRADAVIAGEQEEENGVEEDQTVLQEEDSDLPVFDDVLA